MIFSGIIGLGLHATASQSFNSVTLNEIWHVAEIIQIANFFGAVCIVIAYMRALNFLTPWEYIGVLVLTVFKMMATFVRFVIIFVFVTVGFSSAFHILYPTNIRYNSWQGSVFSTAIGTFSGYNFPEYSNILVFFGPTAAYTLQVLYIIAGVVLLLNFLIAMMNSVYDGIRENATKEYRWLMTIELTQLRMAPWPVPLNILQGVIGLMYLIVYIIEENCCSSTWLSDKTNSMFKEEPAVSNPVVRQRLSAAMVTGYFKESLEDQEYKDYCQFDKFELG